jgi:hypothetical protein
MKGIASQPSGVAPSFFILLTFNRECTVERTLLFVKWGRNGSRLRTCCTGWNFLKKKEKKKEEEKKKKNKKKEEEEKKEE